MHTIEAKPSAQRTKKAHPSKKLTPLATSPAAPNEPYAESEAAKQLASDMAQRNGWDPDWTWHWVAQAQRSASVIRLMTPTSVHSAKNWQSYRTRLVEPTRIDAGVRFWHAHHDTLRRAETQFGVPAWVIAGIIGIETLYGQHTGSFRVLDALTTLALDFPSQHPRAAERTAFFKAELQALLQLSLAQGIAPTEWRGSYAGAMGLPQFMPSSWQKWAIDFDGDGQIDLRRSNADAIGSVAHYLQKFGWKPGLPTHYPVALTADASQLATLLAPDIRPSFSVDQFQALGAQIPLTASAHSPSLALIELLNGDPAQGGSPPSYVAGTDNFYVITRYNWSSYYAMAVIELGQAIARAVAPDT